MQARRDERAAGPLGAQDKLPEGAGVADEAVGEAAAILLQLTIHPACRQVLPLPLGTVQRAVSELVDPNFLIRIVRSLTGTSVVPLRPGFRRDKPKKDGMWPLVPAWP